MGQEDGELEMIFITDQSQEAEIESSKDYYTCLILID